MSHLLAKLAKMLDEQDIPYMVIGGQAVLMYGEPRLTRDIDLTLGATPKDLPRVLNVVSRLGLRVRVRNEDALGKPFVETFERMLHEEVYDGDA